MSSDELSPTSIKIPPCEKMIDPVEVSPDIEMSSDDTPVETSPPAVIPLSEEIPPKEQMLLSVDSTPSKEICSSVEMTPEENLLENNHIITPLVEISPDEQKSEPIAISPVLKIFPDEQMSPSIETSPSAVMPSPMEISLIDKTPLSVETVLPKDNCSRLENAPSPEKMCSIDITSKENLFENEQIISPLVEMSPNKQVPESVAISPVVKTSSDQQMSTSVETSPPAVVPSSMEISLSDQMPLYIETTSPKKNSSSVNISAAPEKKMCPVKRTSKENLFENDQISPLSEISPDEQIPKPVALSPDEQMSISVETSPPSVVPSSMEMSPSDQMPLSIETVSPTENSSSVETTALPEELYQVETSPEENKLKNDQITTPKIEVPISEQVFEPVGKLLPAEIPPNDQKSPTVESSSLKKMCPSAIAITSPEACSPPPMSPKYVIINKEAICISSDDETDSDTDMASGEINIFDNANFYDEMVSDEINFYDNNINYDEEILSVSDEEIEEITSGEETGGEQEIVSDPEIASDEEISEEEMTEDEMADEEMASDEETFQPEKILTPEELLLYHKTLNSPIKDEISCVTKENLTPVNVKTFSNESDESENEDSEKEKTSCKNAHSTDESLDADTSNSLSTSSLPPPKRRRLWPAFKMDIPIDSSNFHTSDDSSNREFKKNTSNTFESAENNDDDQEFVDETSAEINSSNDNNSVVSKINLQKDTKKYKAGPKSKTKDKYYDHNERLSSKNEPASIIDPASIASIHCSEVNQCPKKYKAGPKSKTKDQYYDHNEKCGSYNNISSAFPEKSTANIDSTSIVGIISERNEENDKTGPNSSIYKKISDVSEKQQYSRVDIVSSSNELSSLTSELSFPSDVSDNEASVLKEKETNFKPGPKSQTKDNYYEVHQS